MWIQKLRGGVNSLAYSPDGRTLYVLDTGGCLTAWDVASHARRELFADRRFWYGWGLVPLADGRRLLITHPLCVWDVVEGRALHFGNGHPEIAPWRWIRGSPDGTLRGISTDGRELAELDIATWTPTVVHSYHQVNSVMSDFDVSADGRRAAVVFSGDVAAVFDRDPEQGFRNSVVVKDIRSIHGIRFSPDGGTLAVATVQDGTQTALWDIRTRQPRGRRIPCWPIAPTFTFNPVLPLFAALDATKTLAVWSLEDGRPLRTLDFGLGARVNCAAFSPDGLTCAVGGSNKQFAVFDVDV